MNIQYIFLYVFFVSTNTSVRSPVYFFNILYSVDRRHRCPHRPTNVINKGDQPCTLTEYNNEFKQHPLQMRESFKPSAEALRGGQFEDKTTQRWDYMTSNSFKVKNIVPFSLSPRYFFFILIIHHFYTSYLSLFQLYE